MKVQLSPTASVWKAVQGLGLSSDTYFFSVQYFYSQSKMVYYSCSVYAYGDSNEIYLLAKT